MTKNKIIRGINKYLSENVRKGKLLGGVKFISVDQVEGGFFFDFEGKKYKVYFFEKMDNFPEKSFIRVLDFEREKPSLVQYTIDSSNFITNGITFELMQNRGATIGRKVVGLEEQFNKIMHKNGFSKDNVITTGEFKNLKYEDVLDDIFKWLKIRIKTKLLLEEKYRDIENETDDNILDVKARTEGGLKVIISTRVERDSSLIRQAIQLHGTKCKVCDFDFTKTYGQWANDYIEVHHMQLLSKVKDTTVETNPATDLTVVCSNCHRMIHKKRDIILTVDELKKKLSYKSL